MSLLFFCVCDPQLILLAVPPVSFETVGGKMQLAHPNLSHFQANLRMAHPDCLSVAEKALLDAIHSANAQWSQTQCPSSATTSSSLLPAVSTAATLHLVSQSLPAVESRQTLVLQSLRAKLEEVDRNARADVHSTQMIQTIPEFVTVMALPYSALQQGHSTADDGKIK
ncbi:hypothetical protein Pelo_17502 [Pelomyxa schiedti]|nr:hypothetical protein Pelo_17502 [Pelomyxa schiedti]